MTIRIAILTFVTSFAAITGWLVLREPADGGIAQAPPQPNAPGAPAREKTEEEKTAQPEEPIAITDAERYIRDKLNRIIIPVIAFEDTTVEEALDYIRIRTRELDPEEPAHYKGVSFIIRKPVVHGHMDDLEDDLLSEESSLPTITGRLINKSIPEVLDFICEQSGLRWQITERCILITPIN